MKCVYSCVRAGAPAEGGGGGGEWGRGVCPTWIAYGSGWPRPPGCCSCRQSARYQRLRRACRAAGGRGGRWCRTGEDLPGGSPWQTSRTQRARPWVRPRLQARRWVPGLRNPCARARAPGRACRNCLHVEIISPLSRSRSRRFRAIPYVCTVGSSGCAHNHKKCIITNIRGRLAGQDFRTM